MARSVLGMISVAAIFCSPALAAPPDALKKPVADEYHGTKVVDDYRWLEDWNSAPVKQWSEDQNAYARAYLDKMPCAPGLRARVTEVESLVGVRYLEVKQAGGKVFASKNQPPKQQPMLVVVDSIMDLKSERVVVDPNALDADGGTSMDWFVPSPDGSMLAVSMSSGGSESGDVRVFKVSDGTEIKGDMIARVNGGTAGGSLAWDADSKGFYYTRYPRAGERSAADMDFYMQVYHHTLGEDPAKDRFETGKDYPKIAEIVIEVSPDGKWVLTNVQNGDGGEFIQDLRTPAGKWVRLTTWQDRIVEAKFGHDQAAYLISRKNAPMGKVLRLVLKADAAPALADAQEVVAEDDKASIETDFAARGGIYLTPHRLYVLAQVGGPNELRAYGLHDGKAEKLGVVESLPISTVEHVEHLAGDDLVFQNDCFITPPGWRVLRAAEKGVGSVQPTPMQMATPPNMPEMAVRRIMAESKDGTQVPLNVIARKEFFEAYDKLEESLQKMAEVTKDAKKDGVAVTIDNIVSMNGMVDGKRQRYSIPAPTIVYGYGGYGVNETPAFSRRILLWVEQGGVYVIANIRGGGEFGEKWHLEGNLLKKQNVFDDFIAACQKVVDMGIATPQSTAIMGGSNGGLLMGAVMTQQPQIAKAVVSMVGIYDMLRVELSPNGAFNITEFGTVNDPAQFAALYAYSPYHHVTDGVKYPATLFMTGANDPRVDPMQSRKMTARLQAAMKGVPDSHGGPSPVYLRTSGSTGHGAGTPLSARIEQTVDQMGFLFDQLGVKYIQPGRE